MLSLKIWMFFVYGIGFLSVNFCLSHAVYSMFNDQHRNFSLFSWYICYEFSTGSKPRLQFINIRSTTGFAHSRFCSYVERHLSLALLSSSITIFNIFHFSLKGMKKCFKTYALCITDSYLIGSIYFHIIYRFEPPSIDNATPI